MKTKIIKSLRLTLSNNVYLAPRKNIYHTKSDIKIKMYKK